MKNRPFHTRLGFALAGIVCVWRREASFRSQVAAAGGVAIVIGLVRPGAVWVALMAVTVGAVLALELLNSALEYLMDHLHPAHATEIGRAKDAAAGAVLVASVAALAVGCAMIASVV